jgi:hypothetical protein
MNAYNPTSWKKKIVLAAATLAVSAGVLEVVTSSMMYPDPETMAVRERVLASQSERAQQIREFARGEVRVAGSTTAGRI